MNANGWYTDEDGDQTTFGYATAAVMATYNITENFYTTAGVRYIYLIADNVVDGNGGDQNQFVGSVAVGFAF